MKKDIVAILACPVCKSGLELTITEEEDGEVITGSLYCAKCQHAYPIKETIPDLLPPDIA